MRKRIDDEDDRIPCDGAYKGVGLHAGQCERRLSVVRADIDHVCGLSSVADLMECLRNGKLAPEARLYGGAKLFAMHDAASKARDPTPIDRDLVVALIAPLDTVRWRSPTHYGSDLCRDGLDRDPGDEPIAA